MISPFHRIGIVGAGNLAWNLCRNWKKNLNAEVYFWNRNLESSSNLQNEFGGKIFPSVQELVSSCDAVFILTSDSGIEEIVNQLDYSDTLLIHCSGATSLNVVTGKGLNGGVFYPLMTFSKFIEPDWKDIPILIEGSPDTKERLFSLARIMKANPRLADSEQRAMIHLAAVFACNFTNSMLAISETICRQNKLPFQVLFPLIRETISKALLPGTQPHQVQTGPAIREDQDAMKHHLELLQKNSSWQEIYKLISAEIIKRKNNGNEL